jgi:hypothetical protein
MEKQAATVSTLVTQENEAKNETHYHDDEEQHHRDCVTEIHKRYTRETTFRAASLLVTFFKSCFAISPAKSFEMARSRVPR